MSKNTETLISNAILKYLEKRHSCWFHKNVVAKARLGSGFFSNVGLGVGSADIIGCYKGRFVALEVKTPEGNLSEEQVKWGNMIRSRGGVFECVRCVLDVQRVLDDLDKGAYTPKLLS